MNNRTKKKLASILLVLVLVLGISVGYAIIQSTLEINGTAKVKESSFNVTFTEVNVTTGSVAINTTAGDSAAHIVGTGNNNSIEFNVTLEEPGDFYEFIATVENKGSIDAKLTAAPTISSLTAAQAVYATYTVTYSNDTAIAVNDALDSGAKRYIKVRVQYRDDITADQLPQSPDTLNLSVALQYGQK